MSLLSSILAIDSAVLSAVTEVAYLGTSTPTTVPVMYMNPEEEFQEEEYPCIVLYRVGNVRDAQRIFLPKFRRNHYVGTNLVNVGERESPMPINFLYTIRIYYEYQEDGVDLNLKLMKRFPEKPKPSYITIETVDYDFDYIGHTLFKSWQGDFGLFHSKKTDERRVFCDQYSYWFCSDLDVFDESLYTLISELDISVE